MQFPSQVMQTNSAVLFDWSKISSLPFADNDDDDGDDDDIVDNDNNDNNDWLVYALSGDSNSGGILCECETGDEYSCSKELDDCRPNCGKFISGFFGFFAEDCFSPVALFP